MNQLASFLAVAAFVLSGCAETGADDEPGQIGGPGGASLVGLVVDEAVRPLAKARVVATGASGTLNATSGPDGLFRFDGLAAGVYLVEVAKEFYSTHQQAVDVSETVVDPPLVKFQLAFQPGSVPYVDQYKFDGFFECSAWPTNGCANINILTGIMFCSLDLPCFNVTGDRSVELIPIVPRPTYLQSEMAWTPTNDQGRALLFGIGAATREELQDGFADAYNFTEGESPLMLSLSGDLLNESRIGVDGRQLLIQVSSSVTTPIPGCPPEISDPCGVGVNVQQAYTTFTHAFHGYLPPVGWLFTETGAAPPPPPT